MAFKFLIRIKKLTFSSFNWNALSNLSVFDYVSYSLCFMECNEVAHRSACSRWPFTARLVILVLNGGNRMIYSVKFHQKFHIIPMVMKLWSQKYFFIYKFPLPSDTTSSNGNTLEWILWKKWDEWSWTSMTIKVAKRFFNRTYTN